MLNTRYRMIVTYGTTTNSNKNTSILKTPKHSKRRYKGAVAVQCRPIVYNNTKYCSC